MATLRYKNTGAQVKKLQRILKKHGYFMGSIGGNFLKLTRDAVVRFQMTHIGPDGKSLEVDGVVGANTWWALENPTGEPQRSGISPLIPRRLTPLRLKVLTIAAAEHQRGVKEVPNGSNWGDGVTKYGGRKGWAWCCLFVSWVYREAEGSYPFGKKETGTYRAWQYSKKHGFYIKNNGSDNKPIPGDMFLMQYKKGNSWTQKGHIGFVLRTGPKGFNTIEGNSSNRVKNGSRPYSQSSLIGWINPYPEDEQPRDFEKGLIKGENVNGGSTR